jgi:transcriptional regulator with XRE-family HTH domain
MTGDDVKTARLALGLTQAQLAAVMGYSGKSRIAELESGTRRPSAAAIRLLRAYGAGYRPPDWPLRKAEPNAGPVHVATMPVDEATVRKVSDAIRHGARKAGDIARHTRLGLLTVKDALAEIERRRAAAPGIPAKPAKLHRGRDVNLYPRR